jgi:hypothetical protein
MLSTDHIAFDLVHSTPHLVEKLDKSEYVHEEPPQAKDGEEVLSEGDDDDDDEEE